MKKTSIIFALIIVYPFIAFAGQKYTIIKDGVNVRADSTISAKIVGLLQANDEIEVLGEKYDWCKIKLPKNLYCYIAKEFAKILTEDCAVEVNASDVNLRSGPSLESPIIGKAPMKAVFQLIEESNDWIKIQGYPYAWGWVNKRFLREITAEIIISKLCEPDMKKKESLQRELIEKGEKIIPLLEEQLETCGENTAYSIIAMLTQLGKNNPELSSHFLEKASNSPAKTASAYLDILQEITHPAGPKTSYFYLTQSGEIPPKEISNAVLALKNKTEQKQYSLKSIE